MSESPRDFPRFAAGQTDPQTSARQMQNMSNAAKDAHERQYGPGMTRTSTGTVNLLQDPKRPDLPATRFVAIVAATPEQARLVMVREIVTTLTADVPVNVWNGKPFPAYPAVGTSFAELANAVVDDSDPPSDATPVFGLTKRRRGLPAVYKLGGGGGGGNMAFGVVWPGVEGENSPTVTMRFVTRESGSAHGYVLDPDRGPTVIECWPFTVAGDYQVFQWRDRLLTAGATVLPLVNMGGIWHVMLLPRLSTQKLAAAVVTTDCVMPGTNML